jgi:hypothetical protein
MPAFTKANVIINDKLVQGEMKVCGYSLSDLLSVMNEPRENIPHDERIPLTKYFRRKWGMQKIRVLFSIRKSIEGKEFALINQVVPDVPPESEMQKNR